MPKTEPAAEDTKAGETAAEADAIQDLGYEQARDELAKLVNQLESGSVPLSESLDLWERAEALATHCQQFLDAAKARLTTSTE